MLTLLTLSMFLSTYYSAIIEYDEIGVIERRDDSNNLPDTTQANNSTSDQHGLLRRRLLPGGLTNQDKLMILETHNYYRNLTATGYTYRQPTSSNMNQLIWDPALAQVAQDYSAQCNWGHNSNRVANLANYQNMASFAFTNQGVGENLFLSTGSESLSVLLQGIQYWYDEYTYYTYGTVGGTAQCQSGFQCGHYTQLVWGSTRYVGCGYTKCANPTGTSMKGAILFVCNYYFPGNIVGYSPYQAGTPMTSCPADRTPQGNMCGGCPNRQWDSYCCDYCSSQTCSNAKNSLNSPSSCTDGLGTTIVSGSSRSAIGAQSNPSPTPMPTNPPATPSPTNAVTPSPTNAVTPSPTNAVTPSPTAGAAPSSGGCCKVNNSRYSAFCSSIKSSDVCGIYSIICAWDNSC